ncbi:hypothetical protein [Paraglaciecola chathamensis]|jgi:hypothetical protein|uniref:Uncharacterized protein n=3 Tax=Paraglaciecola chathamensis TaxID=368405 RepID=A0A8H9M1X0_9ALTE|nr:MULTISPECIES: hypothetical protein [Paraglaciecola]AEE25160.1 hypothetical protein Glaag_4237 [Glaciecola sp. 4H-3-7+YE-5]MBJ2137788.1 hypothetical protein [Paraglaciecola chathamensis]MBU3017704.1 hypothetical protein [Paraglaciecola agarilytica]MDO6561135.1 hypothetical protein [Paraglaciecola chathamensis]GAC05914.1 hypothetical protein GAGA_3080 [Paraglaciecola agarilytica NO2]|tara:strand:- start:120 stop:572 length:453 start_codon:yes stop_codon:yes gene_type:complete
MSHNFLCPNHRQWLATNPIAAHTHLRETQDTGQYYRDQGAWQQALPYLGCAYETAEIVMSQADRQTSSKVVDFTATAVLLADTLQKLGQKTLSLAIYDQAQKRLKPELTLSYQQPKLQRCVIDCIKSLALGAGFHQKFMHSQTNEEHALH